MCRLSRCSRLPHEHAGRRRRGRGRRLGRRAAAADVRVADAVGAVPLAVARRLHLVQCRSSFCASCDPEGILPNTIQTLRQFCKTVFGQISFGLDFIFVRVRAVFRVETSDKSVA